MKILFVIPHFYKPCPTQNTLHASHDPAKANTRSITLKNCIYSLYRTFSLNQHMCSLIQRKIDTANISTSTHIDIILITHEKHNLIESSKIDTSLIHTNYASNIEPLFLGFKAYEIFAEHSDEYDWFCYIEDDIIINDPLFFTKISAFNSTANNDLYLIQPNRFEHFDNYFPSKLYIDGDLWQDFDKIIYKHHGSTYTNNFKVAIGDCTYHTELASNPHSGCFFITKSQLNLLKKQPWYGHITTGFMGPLESAATLPIMSTFYIHKPAVINANFLEVHHDDEKISIHAKEIFEEASRQKTGW
ncbi:hypothetical protein FY034_15775 [Trichlorobacter lovleyi]|uniref:hypothetical protein n=1 Tax=Trichlorobacter lovleyi TaxID=313985 RepID=UPI002240BC87|nr:hypothetical protein [Trichlorobacter lovleyi]QOX80333.1 hypothetical protein FY034_15775 [Trichlorobacter lovleyi]